VVQRPKEYGGFIRVTLSLLLEVLFSVLLAPVRMLFHTVFVVSAFLGWEVVWNSPQRDDDSTRGAKPLCVTVRSCCWGWCGRWVWHGWICASCSGWRRSSSR
jgi:membrane glycosyltransferase